MAEAITVSQVNQYIRDLLKRDALLKQLTVKGEVSNCTYHASGHIYFTLKDKGAQLSCIMFAQDRGALRFRLEQGMQVRVTGRVDVYPQGGRYQLYAIGIEEEGAGELYEKFLRLKARLEEEGLFAEEYKRPLPPFVRTLGIVTAPTGAAVRDIIQIAKRRNPYVRILLSPTLVQGEQAADAIAKAIRRMEQAAPDVMIVGRGGGSIEDLWAFNEEVVARALFDCSVPVISAVGHETDFTIADFVADLRAPTPSAAAELAVFDYARFASDLDSLRDSLYSLMTDRLEDARSRLDLQKERLLHRSPAARLRDLKMRQMRAEELLTARMRARLAESRRRIPDVRNALTGAMQARLTDKKQRLRLTAERLNGLSPLHRLKAGYGYVTDDQGKRVHSVTVLHPEDRIRIYFADGVANATVDETDERRFLFKEE